MRTMTSTTPSVIGKSYRYRGSGHRMGIPFLLLLAALFAPLPLPAQSDTVNIALTPESLRAEISDIEAATDLDAETKTAIADTYRRAIAYLESAASSQTAADEFRRAREEGPKQIEALRTKLDRTPKPVRLGVSPEAPLAEIEQALLQEQANLVAVEAKLDALEKQLAAEKERPGSIRKRLTEANQQLADIAAEPMAPAPVGGDNVQMKALRALRQAHSVALNAEIRMLDQELLSQPIRLELLQAQRDEQALNVERIAERARRLGELVAERRRAQTERVLAEAEAARREAEGKHPVVRALAERNAQLVEEIAMLTQSVEKASREETIASEQAKRIAEDSRSVRQKLEIAGLNQALGMVLLEQRRALPDRRTLRKRADAREDEIAVAGLRQIQHEEERRKLQNVDDYVAELTKNLPPGERLEIAPELRDLVEKRRDLLRQAVGLDRAYVRALGDLEFAQRQLVDAIETFDEYLAGRLLWIRSAPPPSLQEIGDFPADLAKLLSPQDWGNAVRVLVVERTRTPQFLLLLTVFGVLLWRRRALWRWLAATSERIGRPTTDRFAFTMQALLYTILLALPWPLLLGFFGWQLRQGHEVTEFSAALGAALAWAAPPLFSYRFARILCHSGGLAARHLDWSEGVRKSLRRALDRLAVVWLPAGSIAVFFANQEEASSGTGVERLTIMLAVLALGAFLSELLHPSHGILLQLVDRERRTLLHRLRYLWFALALAIPVFLLGLAVYGYLYTTAVLGGNLAKMVWFLFLIVVAHELAVRWLTVTHRRLAYQALLERRRAAQAAAEETDASSASEMPRIESQEQPVDLAALSDETRKLLNAALMIAAVIGIWRIWEDVLPALGILDEVILWQQTIVVSGEQQVVPTTLGNALVALVVVIVTIVATRRLPSLLEIVLLQRLKMSPATHYTTTTVSRYMIAGIGGMLAVSEIGFNWSQIQWLIAALGVGIGFGLQEIVANFISGLILLFERPIRVGDIVTVGDTDGVVTRIQIRATTIRTWDRKELLVPNKEFVTGRLLNWSLSDQITRLVINVGVAYGSDVQNAMRLISEAAEENERALPDPKPFVVFDGFGDNALSLTLRCFVGNVNERLDTISEIHQAINQKFNDAGIVIAFPQRDLHFDPRQPLEIRLRRERPSPAEKMEEPR